MSRIPKETRPPKDPFDETEVERRIVVTPIREDKYPKGRAIAAAFWLSYFALHWLTILEVVERSPSMSGTTGYFLLFAALSTLMTIAFEKTKEKK